MITPHRSSQMQIQTAGPLPSSTSGCKVTSTQLLLPRCSTPLQPLKGRLSTFHSCRHHRGQISINWSENNINLSFYVPRPECGADQAVPASTTGGQVLQQPPCFLEDEEEELYISESMQEITDGDITQALYHCLITAANVLTLPMSYSAPPTIQVPHEDLCVEPGQPVTFTAIITGRPAPTIEWYKVRARRSVISG